MNTRIEKNVFIVLLKLQIDPKSACPTELATIEYYLEEGYKTADIVDLNWMSFPYTFKLNLG